jgi:hypothetical protein
MNASQFASKHGITYTYKAHADNVIDGRTPFRWKVTITYQGKTYKTWFTMGAGYVCSSIGGPNRQFDWFTLQDKLKGIRWGELRKEMLQAMPPALPQVLDALHSDCSCYDNNPTWATFASDFGYNVDSIREKKVFKACRKAWGKLSNLFGPTVFAEFLQITDDDGIDSAA